MRVVLATWRFPEPGERYAVNRVLRLVERGIECCVVAEHLLTPFDAALADRLARSVPMSTALSANQRADVFHFEHTGVALRYRAILRSLKGAKIVTCHGSDVRIESIGNQWVREGFAEVFAAVDRVHCVSAELAEHCQALGARSEQLYVAPIGIDRRVFTRRAPAARPESLSLRLVSVGRLNWVKGYEYALHALRLLLDAGHRVSYTIAGVDGGAEVSVRLAIRDFGLESVVNLRGQLAPEGVRDLLAASDVFVLASVSEGSSLATMEAMAMGLPVVVTNVGGNRELATDGVHGFVVPSRDPSALALAIAKLRAAELRTKFGARAFLDSDRFDATREIDRLVEVYEQLVPACVARTQWPACVARTQWPAARRPVVTRQADLVSVVIAARNAAATIDDQLRALSFQDYDGPWEVVVVDNASTDGTRGRALDWADRLPNLRVIDAPGRRRIAYARNVGVRAASGGRIVMCDADDIVAPGWLAALARALDRQPLVRGALERSRLLPPKIDTGAGLDTALGLVHEFRPRVITGNIGFRRELFDAVGGFDESLARGSDLDFGWRAIDAGFEPVFVPDAIVHYRSQWRPGPVARRAFADGRAGAALYARYRHAGMPAPSGGQVRSRYRALSTGALAALRSPAARVGWVQDAAASLGRIAGSIQHRVRFF